MKIITIVIALITITGCASSPESCEGKFINYEATKVREPLYPREAYDQKIEGWAQVAFTVSTDGKATNIKVTDGSPKGVFDRSAIAVVQEARFRPAMQNCQKIEVTNGAAKFHFTLDK